MAETSDIQGIFYQNLIDAGCSEETICRGMLLAQAGKTAELLQLLSCHRKALLDVIHVGQRQLDCLDYLVYQKEKELRQEE